MGARTAPSQSTVVVANLLRPLLLELARTMPCAPTHLLAGRAAQRGGRELTSAFAQRFGLHPREERHSAEWAAVWLSASVTSVAQAPSGISVAARTIER